MNSVTRVHKLSCTPVALLRAFVEAVGTGEEVAVAVLLSVMPNALTRYTPAATCVGSVTSLQFFSTVWNDTVPLLVGSWAKRQFEQVVAVVESMTGHTHAASVSDMVVHSAVVVGRVGWVHVELIWLMTGIQPTAHAAG